MSGIAFASIAKQISERKPKLTYGSYDEHPILDALCAAYMRCNPTEDISWDIDTIEDATLICNKLFRWYSSRYSRYVEHDNREKEDANGKRGIGKNISYKNTYRYELLDWEKNQGHKCQYQTYYFDEPYRKSQFDKYLVNLEIPDRNEDYLGFILHVSVAFFLKPEELDRLLKQCGFQQLHIRNIHHLAIYAVLAHYQDYQGPVGEKDNPFAIVRELYTRGRDILNGELLPIETAEDGMCKDGNLLPVLVDSAEDTTRWMREYLLSKGTLKVDNYDKIVTQYKNSLTMIHKQLIDDHHMLASVFTIVNNPGSTKRGDMRYRKYVQQYTSQYSLYKFINKFCQEKSQREFEKSLFTYIDTEKKHPTREVMILLWIYAYCFAAPDVLYKADDSSINRIEKRLKTCNHKRASDVRKYFETDASAKYFSDSLPALFDVAGFIFDDKKPDYSQSGCFNGAKILALLNEILTSRYEWERLNKKRPFDYYIISILENLRIEYGSRPSRNKTAKIFYNGYEVQYNCEKSNLVPLPLYVIYAILEELSKYDASPLSCGLYEQL